MKMLKARMFECPHCKAPVEVVIETQIVNLVACKDMEGTSLSALTQSEKSVVEIIGNTGLDLHFIETAQFVFKTDAPRYPERFFLTYLRTLQPRLVPRFAMEFFIENFPPKGKFQFWSSQGIGTVVIDDTLRGFVPLELVIGVTAKSYTTRDREVLVQAIPEQLTEWFSAKGRIFGPEKQVSLTSLRRAALNS